MEKLFSETMYDSPYWRLQLMALAPAIERQEPLDRKLFWLCPLEERLTPTQERSDEWPIEPLRFFYLQLARSFLSELEHSTMSTASKLRGVSGSLHLLKELHLYNALHGADPLPGFFATAHRAMRWLNSRYSEHWPVEMVSQADRAFFDYRSILGLSLARLDQLPSTLKRAMVSMILDRRNLIEIRSNRADLYFWSLHRDAAPSTSILPTLREESWMSAHAEVSAWAWPMVMSPQEVQLKEHLVPLFSKKIIRKHARYPAQDFLRLDVDTPERSDVRQSWRMHNTSAHGFCFSRSRIEAVQHPLDVHDTVRIYEPGTGVLMGHIRWLQRREQEESLGIELLPT